MLLARLKSLYTKQFCKAHASDSVSSVFVLGHGHHQFSAAAHGGHHLRLGPRRKPEPPETNAQRTVLALTRHRHISAVHPLDHDFGYPGENLDGQRSHATGVAGRDEAKRLRRFLDENVVVGGARKLQYFGEDMGKSQQLLGRRGRNDAALGTFFCEGFQRLGEHTIEEPLKLDAEIREEKYESVREWECMYIQGVEEDGV